MEKWLNIYISSCQFSCTEKQNTSQLLLGLSPGQ